MYRVEADQTGRAAAATNYSLLEPSEIIGLLRRRWLLVLLTTLLGVALAVGYVVYVPRKYTSETQILIDPRGLQVIGQELTPSGQTSDVNAALIETHMRVLTSDSILSQVVSREQLDKDPEFNGSERNPVQEIRARFRERLGVPARQEEPAEIQALRTLQQRVRAQKPERGYVIDLRVTANDPEKAARLAQAVTSAYLEEEAASRRQLAQRAAQELAGRLDDLAARVKQAEDAVEAYKLNNNLVGASGQLISEQELTALNAQLVAAQSRTAELRSRSEQIEQIARSGRIPENIAETVQSPTITGLRAQFAEVNRLQADLATRLGPRHPDAVAVSAQIQRMRGQINDELNRIAHAARSDYERARANESALAQKLDTLKRHALDISQSLVRLRELERQAQVSRTLYEAFLGRAREVREQQQLDTGNARVISPPIPPERPNGPPAPVVVLMGGAIGFVIGSLLALALDKLGGRVHSARQLTGLTSLPVIGEAPRARRLRAGRRKAGASPQTINLKSLVRGRNDGITRLAWRLHDAVAESGPAGTQRMAIVTSPDDPQGKTAVALSLALGAASRGQRTLLVDADPTGRALTRALGGRTDGLEDVIAGRARLDEAVLVDPQSGVSVLRAGPERLWPGKRYDVSAIRRFMANDAAEFDLIVVDADLIREFGSARPFAEAASQVVLVVKAGTTRFAAIEEARLILGPHAAKVAGAVLTASAPSRTRRLRRAQAAWLEPEPA